MIKCEELLDLEIFKSIELVAGKKGLYRSISWPYAIHILDISEWVHGGELLIVSRYQSDINNDTFKQLLLDAIQYNLSGIILEGGITITKVSDEILEIADKYEFPLFWIPEALSFVDITKAVSSLILASDSTVDKSSAFLEELFLHDRHLTNPDQVMNIAEKFDISLGKIHTIANFHIVPKTDKEGNRLLIESVYRTIVLLLNERKIVPLSKMTRNSIIILVSEDNLDELLKYTSYLEKMHSILEDSYENCTIYLSFGRDYYDPTKISSSLTDSLKAMKLLKSGTYQRHSTKYKEIGSYQLLFEIRNEEEMLKFRDLMLKDIIEYDHKNNAELFHTLKTYLNANGNLAKTAQDLIVHRNTLQYRLDKIRKINNLDLDDPNIRRDYLNAFMILNLYPYPVTE